MLYFFAVLDVSLAVNSCLNYSFFYIYYKYSFYHFELDDVEIQKKYSDLKFRFESLKIIGTWK